MTASDYALIAGCAFTIGLALALLFGCTVAAVSVDCPIATDTSGEAGASP